MRSLLLLLLLAGAAAPAARADYTLQYLLDNPNVTIVDGDKSFSNFTYSTTGSGMPAAANVNVAAYTDPISGDYGIQFQGGFTSNGGVSDALIGFQVTVTDPRRKIEDASLSSNPSNAGSTGSIGIVETFAGISNKKLDVYANSTGFQLTDHTVFDTPLSTLFVSKDVQANWNGVGQPPTISYIRQNFSQTPVPEPASLALLGGGLVFALGYRRFRKGNALGTD